MADGPWPMAHGAPMYATSRACIVRRRRTKRSDRAKENQSVEVEAIYLSPVPNSRRLGPRSRHLPTCRLRHLVAYSPVAWRLDHGIRPLADAAESAAARPHLSADRRLLLLDRSR